MPTEAEIIESAITAIEGILNLPILERHKRDLINGMLWKLTEARGKYTTRYRSRGALDAPKGTKLQHEHVITRRYLVNSILQHPERAREFAATAVGCVGYERRAPADDTHHVRAAAPVGLAALRGSRD